VLTVEALSGMLKAVPVIPGTVLTGEHPRWAVSWGPIVFELNTVLQRVEGVSMPLYYVGRVIVLDTIIQTQWVNGSRVRVLEEMIDFVASLKSFALLNLVDFLQSVGKEHRKGRPALARAVEEESL